MCGAIISFFKKKTPTCVKADDVYAKAVKSDESIASHATRTEICLLNKYTCLKYPQADWRKIEKPREREKKKKIAAPRPGLAGYRTSEIRHFVTEFRTR